MKKQSFVLHTDKKKGINYENHRKLKNQRKGIY